MNEKRKSTSNGHDDDPPTKKLSSSNNTTNSDVDGLLHIRGYHSDRKGERDDMQDAHVVLDDMKWLIEGSTQQCDTISRIAYYAVFDGHNGPRASTFSSQNLHLSIAQRLVTGPDIQTVEQSLKRMLVESYKKTDEQFLSDSLKAKPVWKDGTTATTVLVINNSAFIANLGDSKAILCRFKTEEQKEIALTLTKDHSPQVFEERMRIQKSGGNVKDGRILGILEVSRSIGDGQYKNHGVTCIPDVKKCTLSSDDRYLLIGCDGLWKTFTNQEVLDFISFHIKDVCSNTTITTIEGKTLEQVRWETVCSRLAGEAVRKGSGDNITVVITVINDWYL